VVEHHHASRAQDPVQLLHHAQIVRHVVQDRVRGDEVERGVLELGQPLPGDRQGRDRLAREPLRDHGPELRRDVGRHAFQPQPHEMCGDVARAGAEVQRPARAPGDRHVGGRVAQESAEALLLDRVEDLPVALVVVAVRGPVCVDGGGDQRGRIPRPRAHAAAHARSIST
jgi:hypothetical protein